MFPISFCAFFACLEIYMMCGAAVNEKVLDPSRTTLLRIPEVAPRAPRG
jgi:hypothetical protein